MTEWKQRQRVGDGGKGCGGRENRIETRYLFALRRSRVSGEARSTAVFEHPKKIKLKVPNAKYQKQHLHTAGSNLKSQGEAQAPRSKGGGACPSEPTST